MDEAVAAGAPEEEIAALRAEAEELTATRDTMFQGQMLRTALLTSYAWSTVGQIAQLSAAAAVAVAVALAALVILDAIRDRRRKPRMVLG